MTDSSDIPLWKRQPGSAVLFDNASHKPNTAAAARAASSLLATLAEAGWSVDTLRPRESDFVSCLDRIEAERPSLILAFGGDGTIAACAQRAVKVGASLLPIPGGTMNLSAKDAGSFGDLASLAQRAMLGRDHAVDLAEIGGVAFLHSVAIGLVPWIGRHRERFRELPLHRRWRAVAAGAREALTREPTLVGIRAERGSAEARTLCAVIANNPLHWHYDVHFGRATLDRGVLAIYLSTHAGAIGRIALMLSLVTGQFELDARFRKASARELTIDTPSGRIDVSVDGEIMSMETPLAVRQHPRALRMLIPAEAEGA